MANKQLKILGPIFFILILSPTLSYGVQNNIKIIEIEATGRGPGYCRAILDLETNSPQDIKRVEENPPITSLSEMGRLFVLDPKREDLTTDELKFYGYRNSPSVTVFSEVDINPNKKYAAGTPSLRNHSQYLVKGDNRYGLRRSVLFLWGAQSDKETEIGIGILPWKNQSWYGSLKYFSSTRNRHYGWELGMFKSDSTWAAKRGLALATYTAYHDLLRMGGDIDKAHLYVHLAPGTSRNEEAFMKRYGFEKYATGYSEKLNGPMVKGKEIEKQHMILDQSLKKLIERFPPSKFEHKLRFGNIPKDTSL